MLVPVHVFMYFFYLSRSNCFNVKVQVCKVSCEEIPGLRVR